MLAVEYALVRITRRAVFAEGVVTGAEAVKTLVQDNAVSWAQAFGLGAHLLNNANDFMAEDLRLGGKRNQGPAFVGIVVRVASEDVEVCSTEANSLNPYKHVGWPDLWERYIKQIDLSNACQNTGTHCSLGG
jgi:hypothetical protein